MSWVLWLDDIHQPPKTKVCVWAKSTEEAIAFTLKLGIPQIMHLDHDLGNDDTAMDYLKWLAETFIIDKDQKVPTWYVHSANPVGKANINGYLTCLANFKNR